MTTTHTPIAFNGIDGATGKYLWDPSSVAAVADIAMGLRPDRREVDELRRGRITKRLGLHDGADPMDLGSAGWGVVFGAGNHARTDDIRHALKPLFDHREHQAKRIDERCYKEYSGDLGYRAGESKNDFLTRHEVGPGLANPGQMPYYMLIVGSPEEIPFRFQQQLDVQRAVGRIHFETVEEYANYAAAVVRSESDARRQLPRRAAFFAPRAPGDMATQLSADELVEPLSAATAHRRRDWTVESIVGERATKAALIQLLGGERSPALLFTASHGVGFPRRDPRQMTQQGGLLCQDWPGPDAPREPLSREWYVGAEDIADVADLSGMIAFHFACYSAGTPMLDDFAHLTTAAEPASLASQSFVAPLARRMLGHPSGALAVIGHVDRAWGCSFLWDNAGRQIGAFEAVVERLLDGHPVGSAMEPMNMRYADIASDLSPLLENLRSGLRRDDEKLVSLWTANNDARDYTVIGDPAVRLTAVPRNAT